VLLASWIRKDNVDKAFIRRCVAWQPSISDGAKLVFHRARKAAGIRKEVSFYVLRHSFATHLIEKGTDITMIQKLPGHNSIHTTLRYLHTSNKDLLKIISPLDDLPLR
jgi:integrase/recombinase XerD